MGGPLLWPADEPWPECSVPHERNTGRRMGDIHRWRHIMDESEHRSPEPGLTDIEQETLTSLEQEHHVEGLRDTDPTPLLPLAQLYTKDIPGLTAPDGCDLLQILWCPFDAHGFPRTPGVHLKWRKASERRELLTEPPSPAVVGDAGYVPEPCVLHPEEVQEHEYLGLLDDELRERIEEWDEASEEADDDAPLYQYDLSIPPGWKVGGFASWHVTDPHPMVCDCGTPMQVLVTIASSEWDGGNRSWVPVEDRDALNVRGASTPTKVLVGRSGSLRIFTCPADPRHEHKVNLQ